MARGSVPLVFQDRPWWLDVLLRGPGVYSSKRARVIITLVIAAGAAATAYSGWIHLYLWGKQFGYRDIPTIGPLFLLQGIVCILMALVTIVTRRVVVLIVTGGMLIASFCALIIAVEVGLFGWQDSWSAQYALTALYDEIAGAALLLGAAVALAWKPRTGRNGSRSQATQGHRAVGGSWVAGS